MFLDKHLDPALSPKQFWKRVDSLGITNSNTQPQTRFTASEFSDYFSNVPSTPAPLSNFDMGFKDSGFSFRNIDFLELVTALNNVKSDAVGLDKISLKFIKRIFHIIGRYLLHVVNTFITTSTFPECWKTAKITPIPKISDPTSVTDYRPISILPALSKVFESILKNQIMTHINGSNLLSEFQSAYRSHHGTHTALLNITDDMRRNADKKLPTILALLDFSKAFDTINHVQMVGKLFRKFGFSSTSCKLILSYLSDRKQCVCTDSKMSEMVNVMTGVPQGSVLGPLLFSLYINDLPSVVQFCNFHLYADDVQLYISCNLKSVRECCDKINSDIQRIVEWSSKNHLLINSKKTQSIVLYKYSIDTSSFPKIVVDNTAISYSETVKNLGITMSKDLTWSQQISDVRRKVSFMLRKLWNVAKDGSVQLKKKLVMTYILPHFLYCDCVMFGMYEYEFRKLDLLFNSTTRFVYSIRKFDHISPYKTKVLSCTLRCYLKYRVAFLISKILKYGSPTYLSHKLNKLTSTRSNNLVIPRNTSVLLNSSFFVRGVSHYNSLPSSIKLSSSESSFRENYFKHFGYVRDA